MATKKITPEDVFPGIADAEPVDPDVLAVVEELAGSADPAARVSVSRVKEGGGAEYCASYAPAEFTIDRLAQDFGGGRYQIRVYATNPNNSGRPSMKATRTVEIAKPVIPIRAAESSSKEMFALLEKVTAQQAQQQREMLERIERLNRDTPKTDPAESLAKMIAAIAPIVAAVAPMLKPEKTGVGELIGALRDLRELQEPAPEKQSDSGLLVEGLKTIQTAMLAQQTASPVSPVPAAPSVSSVPAPVQTRVDDPYSSMLDVCERLSHRSLDTAETAADMICEMLADHEYSQLAAFLQLPDWFGRLKTMRPTITDERRAWWEALAREILTGAQPDEAFADQQPASPDLTA